ncbi:MAG: hypothetical protein ACOZAA_07945 [Pseudomonadota bacterium]
MAAIFELDEVEKLPLRAQALIASRMARRAILHLPREFSEGDRQAMLALCDALDRAAATGDLDPTALDEVIERALATRGGPAGEAAEALYWAWDAAGAAIGALDFPVDDICIMSASNAIASASRTYGMTPLQAVIFAAADLDLLRFACKEANVGFYDALGAGVMGRLPPVHPPDER